MGTDKTQEAWNKYPLFILYFQFICWTYQLKPDILTIKQRVEGLWNMGYATNMNNLNDNQALCGNLNRLKQKLKEHQNSDECKGENCQDCIDLQKLIDAANPTLP